MEPRRRPRHARNASAPRHTSYAAGEDVAAPSAQPEPTAGRARPRRVSLSQGRRAHRPQRAPTRAHLAGEALATSEARRARWRRPDPRRVRLARLARVGAATAQRAGRLLRRIPPGRAISLGIPLTLLLALLIWLQAGSYWQVRAVRIQGTSDPSVLALAHAQRLTGCNIFRCDFSAAQRAIAASPRVQRVSIRPVYPAMTLVTITSRQTAALWRTQGQTWAVGADGVIVGSIQREPSLAANGAAVVDDPTGAAFAGQAPQPGARMDAALVAMATQLRKSALGAGLDATSLRYSSADGFTMRVSGSGALVLFGAPRDAVATLADLTSASPGAVAAQAASPAETARGVRAQVAIVRALLARLAQTGTSATLLDVRWGAHPSYH